MNIRRYDRHLAHWLPQGTTLHVTWRLANSRASADPEILFRHSLRTGPTGPMWLSDARIAQVVVDARILIGPYVELGSITCWLKGRTARIANRIPGRTKQPFWHEESYDHIIRSSAEFRNEFSYMEKN